MLVFNCVTHAVKCQSKVKLQHMDESMLMTCGRQLNVSNHKPLNGVTIIISIHILIFKHLKT